MWLPIIHNLLPTDPAYKAAQHYNKLVVNKPKTVGTLAQKLKLITQWQAECNKAMDDVKAIMNKD